MRRNWYPFRDAQRDLPQAVCAGCGQEQYDHDPPLAEGLCPRCRRREEKREEDAMTLREMGGEYRAQAQVLQARIGQLEEACRQTEDDRQRAALEQRIWMLTQIWRETRDQAVLLEHYYERGYWRNARYTL